MTRILLTASADQDSASILDYLSAKAGQSTALKYSVLFASLYKRLAVDPMSGPQRPKLGPDVRIAVVAPYVVTYKH